MPRLRLRHFVVLFAGLGLAPGLASAQQVEPRTYTVKRGDTLWDIAKQYLGDAYLWPEIYRLNTATIEDPHWIYPSEVLILPGMGTIANAGDVPSTPCRTSHERITILNPLTRTLPPQSRTSRIPSPHSPPASSSRPLAPAAPRPLSWTSLGVRAVTHMAGRPT